MAVLEARGIVKRFGGLLAVSEASLEAHASSLAASGRFRTPSLRYAVLVCCLTVHRDRRNNSAISGLMNPEARCCRMSSARFDNDTAGFAVRDAIALKQLVTS